MLNDGVLEKGTVVRLINKQHVWYNEIGVIRLVKPNFYRLELHGKLIWVPQDWVIEDEPE